MNFPCYVIAVLSGCLLAAGCKKATPSLKYADQQFLVVIQAKDTLEERFNVIHVLRPDKARRYDYYIETIRLTKLKNDSLLRKIDARRDGKQTMYAAFLKKLEDAPLIVSGEGEMGRSIDTSAFARQSNGSKFGGLQQILLNNQRLRRLFFQLLDGMPPAPAEAGTMKNIPLATFSDGVSVVERTDSLKESLMKIMVDIPLQDNFLEGQRISYRGNGMRRLEYDSTGLLNESVEQYRLACSLRPGSSGDSVYVFVSKRLVRVFEGEEN
ncbi:hypothetical protein ACWKWU_05805 [Chitinophaga lutea]